MLAKKDDDDFYYPTTEKVKQNKKEIKIPKSHISEPITISTPKGEFHERVFGIIDPKKYHDLSKHIIKERNKIGKIIYNKENKIYSYGLPFPPPIHEIILKEEIGRPYLYTLKRSGQSIDAYLKAEEALLTESYKYKYVLKTDIKNFYPSIYTHALCRAIEGKKESREIRGDMSYIGNIIDTILQKAHDNCTNGIAIGPAISDFIGEILLAKIDTQVSRILDEKKIDFLGVRYKDDYKILTQSKNHCDIILSEISKALNSYNLYIHEGKTEISNMLPEKLFRPWILEVDKLYHQYILENRDNNKIISKNKIGIRKIKQIYFELLKIDNKYPSHNVFEKMLSKLVYKTANEDIYKHCFLLTHKDITLFISLLLQIKNRRLQALPLLLGVIEIILNKKNEKIIYNALKIVLDTSDHDYETIRLLYFFRKQDGWRHSEYRNKYKDNNNKFISTLAKNKQTFFEEFNLFDKSYTNYGKIWDNLSLFGYEQL